LALEQAYRFGEKPVTPEIIETVMAPDLNALGLLDPSWL
jgi:hypothetical protein